MVLVVFSICFRELLRDVCQKYSLSMPMYGVPVKNEKGDGAAARRPVGEAPQGARAAEGGRHARQRDVPFTHADVASARADLGYLPRTNLDAGLKKSAKWYLSYYGYSSSSSSSRGGGRVVGGERERRQRRRSSSRIWAFPIADQFTGTTISNVPKGSPLLWIHFLLMAVVVAIAHFDFSKMEDDLRITRFRDGVVEEPEKTRVLRWCGRGAGEDEGHRP
uniref:Uncharacterized protein n=1 Tax=Ananas comosus var. bracteatus TaxID=296719 RepID=A0A6V7QP51_ANACO|nr:unnamed protein product [Ananas comosus var. bracteatus]